MGNRTRISLFLGLLGIVGIVTLSPIESVEAEGFYCNNPGQPCEPLNVNDCRSIYPDWQVKGQCTIAYPDIVDCAASTSCTY